MYSFWPRSRSKSDQMAEAEMLWIDEVFAALLVGTAALLFLTVLVPQSRRRLPPGPSGWPILGSLLSVGRMPHESFYEMSKKYGPLMLVHLGSVRTVVVTSPEMAEEIFKKNDHIMASRPSLTVVNEFFHGPPPMDLAFAPYGQRWRNARKNCTVGLLTQARISEFRKIREREVLATLHYTLEESQRGNVVNMDEALSSVTANNITQMLMKRSFLSRTSDSESAVCGTSPWPHYIKQMLVLFGTPNISDCVPLLKPFDIQGLQKRAKEVHENLDSFLQGVIDDRRRSLSTGTPENYKEDFLDALLEFGTTQVHEKISDNGIKSLLMDLFGAGSDTSSTAAHWALTELVRHPKVMRKAQEELDIMVGAHRLVRDEDLLKLKYLTAVIKETLRLHPPGPLLVPHLSTEDCEIQGFHIPAKTQIMINCWAIHRDPAVWERPLEFDPERFLNSSVDYRGQDFKFLPFGSGRRMCPGVNLGITMVLYPIAVLLHAADWSTAEGERAEEVDMSEGLGIALHKRLPLMLFGKARLPHHVIYSAQQVEN